MCREADSDPHPPAGRPSRPAEKQKSCGDLFSGCPQYCQRQLRRQALSGERMYGKQVYTPSFRLSYRVGNRLRNRPGAMPAYRVK